MNFTWTNDTFTAKILNFCLLSTSLFPFITKGQEMESYNKALESLMESNVATADNLADFELVAPTLSPEEEYDTEQALRAEASKEIHELGKNLLEMSLDKVTVLGHSPNIVVEIFQNAKSVGKQFLLLREYGQIRYVFAISAGGHGRITPGGTYGVSASGASSTGQKWRHMSMTYPSKGENNMDHVTYFRPAIGFHSTTFGLYHKLGRADSHGCVRMARPQARAVYAAIHQNNRLATIISRRQGEPNEQEIPLIKTQLAQDLNFIQSLIKNRNRADTPFKESEYIDFINNRLSSDVIRQRMKERGYKTLTEIPRELDRGPIPAPRADLI